jgi:hypothetical protein
MLDAVLLINRCWIFLGSEAYMSKTVSHMKVHGRVGSGEDCWGVVIISILLKTG